MLIERLFNHVGEGPLFGLVLVLVTVPLATIGLVLRRRARAARLRWSLVRGARRPLKDLAPGRVATVGTWRNLEGGVSLIEDGEHRAIVEREPDAPLVPDGTRILVSGFATRQKEDPRGMQYRSGGRLWVIEGAGEPVLIALDGDDSAGMRRARLSSGVGAMLLATGVAVAVAMGAICWRAANDPASLYTTSTSDE